MPRLAAIATHAIAGLVLAGAGYLAVTARHPLPDPYVPGAVPDPSAPETFVTPVQMAFARENYGLCRQAIANAGVAAPARGAVAGQGACGVEEAVRLSRLSEARLRPLTVPCALALPLLSWEVHDLQPAAREHLGTSVARVLHYGAYACRSVRTDAGEGARLSAHATGEAIDIAGFELSDGRRVTVLDDWAGDGPRARFLRAAFEGLCGRFAQVLGPDYNAAHANHFHAAIRGWGMCR